MSEYLPLAQQLVRAAGAVLRARFHQARTIEFKADNRADLVTDADRASEALILEMLAREVPHHAVLAEEQGAVGQGEWRWIVDPLDGTTNYAHGVPHFCVTVALQGPEGLVVGATYDPLRDELFSAARGLGATLNGQPLRASRATEVRGAVLATGFPYRLRERPELPLGLFSRVVREAEGIRRMGSAALDFAYVAAGRLDGFFELGLKPWDTAAGALLVSEAGGQVRRIDGAPYEPRFGDVVAAAPGLAAELTQLCAQAVSSFGWSPESARDERV